MGMKKNNFDFNGNDDSLLWWISECLCRQPITPLLDTVMQNPELRQIYGEATEDSKEMTNFLFEEIIKHCSENKSKEEWNTLIEDTVNTIERETFFRGLLLGIRLQKEYNSL